ncbi:MAG: tetratricopeptide repeat protein, partial [Fidelibacterota bacterium]
LAWAFDITDKGIVRTRGKTQATATSRRPILTNRTLGIVAALAFIVAVWALLREPSPGGAAISSIAVLPLDNLMGDPEQDYFVDGMHEALITELAKISALRVISRTSTLGFSEAGTPIPEIAQALGVDAIVEGSVLMVGERVRINAQLIDGRREQHLWADAYERALRDVLALHQEVALDIAKQVRVALTPEDQVRLGSPRAVNPEAYDLYLKGWHFRTKETPEGYQKAVDYLEQAVANDPSFARAYASLVQGYIMLDFFRVISGREARINARDAIEKALELDDTIPDTHISLGLYFFHCEWDWSGAERAFRRAIELDPNHVHARFEYGLFLVRMGRFEEALVELQQAKELDPLSLQVDFGIGFMYMMSRQYDKAIEQFKRILEVDPGQYISRLTLAQAYSAKTKYAEALEEYQKLGNRTGIMYTNYAMGRKTEAQAYFDSLKVAGMPPGAWLVTMAVIYSFLGDKEAALNLLEEAYRERSWDMYSIISFQPVFDPLRAEPRFKALLEKLGLTELFDQYGQRVR